MVLSLGVLMVVVGVVGAIVATVSLDNEETASRRQFEFTAPGQIEMELEEAGYYFSGTTQSTGFASFNPEDISIINTTTGETRGARFSSVPTVDNRNATAAEFATVGFVPIRETGTYIIEVSSPVETTVAFGPDIATSLKSILILAGVALIGGLVAFVGFIMLCLSVFGRDKTVKN